MGYDGNKSERISHRIWLLTALLACLLLNVAYSSNLTAILLSETNELPIKTLQDIYDRRSEYSLGLVGDTFAVDLFKFAGDNDVLLRDLWREVISKDPRNIASEKANVERCLEDSKHLAIMDYHYYIDNFADCRLTVLPEKVITASISFPMRRNHPANPIINFELLKMSESGVLQKLLARWHGGGRACESELLHALGLAETYTAFVLLAVGVTIASVLLAVENFT
ncbi:glutamate receptor ionotropic, delta-1 [Hyalella azteca]|nr:glutamate receptor ionotropic, delta-1 [Hyalella azteca]